MSVEAVSFVWDIADVTPEEKLMLLWIANNSGGLGHPVMVDPHGMGQFICSDHWGASEVWKSLEEKGLIRWGSTEDETSSYVWLTYSGSYEMPFDWTGEPKGRSKRVLALIERDGPTCAYCDCTPVVYEVDHFIPRAKGGGDTMNNLVLACSPCNRAKRDLMPEEFLSAELERFYILSTNLKHLHE